MRIVRHPNIVELKAFYYSNGERVSILILLIGSSSRTQCHENSS